MDVDAEEGEAVGMEEDTPQDEVEEVENQQDLTLLERFQQGLDLDSPPPPQDYVPDYWWANPDSDDETLGPRVGPNDIDTGF
jgi:hypothetical protein